MWKVRNALFLIVCLISLNTSNGDEEVKRATNHFTLDLLKAILHNKTGNVVVSPVSIHTLLAVLQQGAAGNTLQEVNNAVHAQPEQTKQAYNNLTNRYKGSFGRTELEFSTRAFAGAGFNLKSDFKQTLITDFQSDIESVNFADNVNASAHINNWVSQATHHKINELINSDDIDAYTRLILVNAIYFKSFWDNPFSGASNKAFSPTNGTEIQVPTLNQVVVYSAGECLHIGAKYVHLDFVDSAAFTLLLVLPTERYGLDALLDRLTPNNLTNIFRHSGQRRVNLQFPKFRLKSDTKLNDIFHSLGLHDVFKITANLSGISEEAIALDKAFQKAQILADENGVTAAAATGFTFFALSARIPKPAEDLDFIADHPFLFFIVDRTNQVPLFAGRVSRPSAE